MNSVLWLLWLPWWLWYFRVWIPFNHWRKRELGYGRWQVNASVWLGKRGWYRLRGLLYRWWNVRNWWLHNYWWRDSWASWRFHMLDWIRPKCSKCEAPMHLPFCAGCQLMGALKEAGRKQRLEKLIAGRQRYGSD